jgi:hypothetical protein
VQQAAQQWGAAETANSSRKEASNKTSTGDQQDLFWRDFLILLYSFDLIDGQISLSDTPNLCMQGQ